MTYLRKNLSPTQLAAVIRENGHIVDRDGVKLEVPADVHTQIVRRLNAKIWDDMVRDALAQGYGVSREEGDRFESLELLLKHVAEKYQMPRDQAAAVLSLRNLVVESGGNVQRAVRRVRDCLKIGTSPSDRVRG